MEILFYTLSALAGAIIALGAYIAVRKIILKGHTISRRRIRFTRR